MIGKFLKRAGKFAGKAGLSYAKARYPFLDDLLEVVAKGIDEAEAGGGAGADKKERVLSMIDIAGEQIIEQIHAAGMAVKDEEGFFKAASQLVEALHGLRKSVVPAGYSGLVAPGRTLIVENGRITGVE